MAGRLNVAETAIAFASARHISLELNWAVQRSDVCSGPWPLPERTMRPSPSSNKASGSARQAPRLALSPESDSCTGKRPMSIGRSRLTGGKPAIALGE